MHALINRDVMYPQFDLHYRLEYGRAIKWIAFYMCITYILQQTDIIQLQLKMQSVNFPREPITQVTTSEADR